MFFEGCKLLHIESQGNSEIKDGISDRLHKKCVHLVELKTCGEFVM